MGVIFWASKLGAFIFHVKTFPESFTILPRTETFVTYTSNHYTYTYMLTLSNSGDDDVVIFKK